jgi:hypothetical protein
VYSIEEVHIEQNIFECKHFYNTFEGQVQHPLRTIFGIGVSKVSVTPRITENNEAFVIACEMEIFFFKSPYP